MNTYINIGNEYLRLKRALFDKYYHFLNDRQREAVYTVNGPLLVLAGAGSGKTTVLVNRIAHIIRYGNAYHNDYVPNYVDDNTLVQMQTVLDYDISTEDLACILDDFSYGQAKPWAVMAITFTNKAANEIKTRLVSSLKDEDVANDIWSGTFHSICMRILRRHASEAGYASGFGVCDTDDTKRLMLQCMKELNIDDKNLPVKSVQKAISNAKDQLMLPGEYELQAGSDFKLRQISKIYTMYQKKLAEANLLDFDDIIMQTVFLLENHDEIRTYYNNRFDYINVDEFQDTNKAQLKLSMLLTAGKNNIMVVGDDDQSIYKFRGATIENILNFDHSLPNTKVIKLEQNYRSTANILNAANGIIAHNSMRKPKALWTAGNDGESIHLTFLGNQNTEARYIIDKIGDLMAEDHLQYRDFAILYRTNAQSQSLEAAFTKSGTPYRMLSGTRFYDRKEIRDILAYLCLVNNPMDTVRLRRIINEPKRKIGETSLNAAETVANELGTYLFDILRHASDFAVIPKQASSSMMNFASMIDALSAQKDQILVSELITKVIDKSGYRKMLEEAGIEEKERLENIEELISAAVEYENNSETPTLTGFLEEVALVSDVDKYDETADAVVMMTIHSAKGLEFPVVFLPGMEEGLFPGLQSMNFPDEIEEERRLAYVAVTRAKKRLLISHVKERMLYGRTQYNQLSRFVKEIPENLIETEDRVSYFGNNDAMKKRRIVFEESARPELTVKNRIDIKKSPAATMNTKKETSVSVFSVGDTVSHANFGIGVILSKKDMGGDVMYEIMFDTVGTKKLMATYAKLKKI